MAISYKGLLGILHDRQIQFKTLGRETGISHATLSRINKGEYISLETLEIIAKYLDVGFGDLIERKADK